MPDVTATSLPLPAVRDSLHEVLREGARKMLAQAVEAEVADWIDRHAHLTDEQGRRQVVRNGHLPERKLVTPVGDGALGFWKALAEVYPNTREQRCWVHKTANVLDKLPKGKQPRAKAMLHEIWMSASQAEAEQALDAFVASYEAKYPKATGCLTKDRDVLLSFYDFPAEHWRHLRTTNPIESTFATIRLRHRRTKGSGSRTASLTMMFKLAESAAKRWRLLNGHDLLPDVFHGVTFQDGLPLAQAAA